jgi:hypothetical protein
MAQKVITETVELAAQGSPGDEVDNILAGTDLEFAPGNGRVVVYLSGSQNGARFSVRTPNQPTIVDDQSVGASDNNPPLFEQDLKVSPFRVRRGERIQIPVRNTETSQTNVFATIQYQGS